MPQRKFKRGDALYEKHNLSSRVTVVRYTAHGLIEVKDAEGRKGFVNPDEALTAAERRAREAW